MWKQNNKIKTIIFSSMLILTILHAICLFNRIDYEYLNQPLPLSTWACLSVCVSSQPGCWGMCSSCRDNLMAIICHLCAAVTSCLSVCLSGWLQLRYMYWLCVRVSVLLPSFVHFTPSRKEARKSCPTAARAFKREDRTKEEDPPL